MQSLSLPFILGLGSIKFFQFSQPQCTQYKRNFSGEGSGKWIGPRGSPIPIFLECFFVGKYVQYLLRAQGVPEPWHDLAAMFDDVDKKGIVPHFPKVGKTERILWNRDQE